MEDDRERLREQIIRISGEVKTAASAEWTRYGRLSSRIKTLKVIDIILTAVSSVGIISFFFHGNLQINILTSFITLASLTLNLYTSYFRDDDDKTLHADCVSELWSVEKGLESLLTDFDSLSTEDVKAKRDSLVNDTDRINREYLCLNNVSFSAKRKAKKPLTIPPEISKKV